MWYVTVHGVGDSEPGASAERLAVLLLMGHASLASDGRTHHWFHVGAPTHPPADLVESNWSDVGRPWHWIPGMLRHLAALGIALLHLDPNLAPAAGNLWGQWLYRFALEFVALWTVYPVLLVLGFESLARWKLALYLVSLFGVLLAAVALLWSWSRWLLVGGVFWLVLTAGEAVLLGTGCVDQDAVTAWSARIYGLSQFALLGLLVPLLAQAVRQFAMTSSRDRWQSMALLAAQYLPLLLLSAFGSCVWAIALWETELLGKVSPSWKTIFLENVWYDVALVEGAMALVTVLIALLAAVGATRYFRAMQKAPASGPGAGVRNWLRVMLIAMPALLLLPGLAMVLTSPLFRSWPRLDQILEISVFGIYTASATRVVALLPLLSRRLAPVLHVIGDVVFYTTDPHSPLSSRAECQGRLTTLLGTLNSLNPGRTIRVVTHSQGSVIAYDVIQTLAAPPGALPAGLNQLVTMGSPLQSLYADFLGWTIRALPAQVRWINLHRTGDYIGGVIPLLQPGGTDFSIGYGGHTGYWSDGNILPYLLTAVVGQHQGT